MRDRMPPRLYDGQSRCDREVDVPADLMMILCTSSVSSKDPHVVNNGSMPRAVDAFEWDHHQTKPADARHEA